MCCKRETPESVPVGNLAKQVTALWDGIVVVAIDQVWQEKAHLVQSVDRSQMVPQVLRAIH